MRWKSGLWLACASLASCNEQTEAPEKLVLECTGTLLTKTPQEAFQSIVRVFPGNDFQTELHFWNFDEERFVGGCPTTDCSLNTNARFIEQVSRVGGEVFSITEINRTTGKWTQTMHVANMPPQVLAEANCTKIDEPAEAKTKL